MQVTDAQVTETPRPVDTPPRRPGAISSQLAAGVGVSFVVLTAIAAALEPTTSADVPAPLVVLGILGTALTLATITGLVLRERWGLVAAFATAVFSTVGSIACPMSGHHPIGLWWAGQLACVLAMVVISVEALRVTRRSH